MLVVPARRARGRHRVHALRRRRRGLRHERRRLVLRLPRRAPPGDAAHGARGATRRLGRPRARRLGPPARRGRALRRAGRGARPPRLDPRRGVRAMKVLMTADTVGGVFTYATELARALRASGDEVVVATMGAPLSGDQRRALAGTTVHESTYAL